MKKNTTIIILILLFIPLMSFSQEIDSTLSEVDKQLLMKQPVGTEFWLTFMQNYKDDNSNKNTKNKLLLELFLTSDFDANVVIEIASFGFRKEVFVPAETVIAVDVDAMAQITSSEVVEEKLAVHITSDKAISVYGLNRRYQTTDTYLGLPVNVLGTEYRVMSYHIVIDLLPEFAIVATEDNTLIEITPTSETMGGAKANEPFEVTLNQGDVYQVKSRLNKENSRNSDLTGSYIKANNKIAVFSGHQCAYVPVAPPVIIACNHLVEQLPPISSWGKHFYIGRLEKRTKYTYRILANEDDTKVFINGNLVAELNAGQYFEDQDETVLQVTATKPVLVAQYSQGYKNGDLIGDPMMLLISPTQQFLKQYRFATPVNGFWDHYVNVVVPTKAVGSFKLNGESVSSRSFEKIGLSRYSIAYLKVPFGTHFISCDEPFGMYSYGFGFNEDAFDAYGTMGGQSFMEYVDAPDITAPSIDIEKDRKGNSIVIIRDDRRNDTGIMEVAVKSDFGILFKVDEYTPGTPLVRIEVDNKEIDKPGRIEITTTDLSGNVAESTLCYTFDYTNREFVFTLNDGHSVTCLTKSGIDIGFFGKTMYSYHHADFVNTGNINTLGEFSDAIGSGGGFGLYAGYRFKKNLVLAARLSFEQNGGVISSNDSTNSNLLDPRTAELVPVFESYNLKLNSYYLNTNIGAEWYFMKTLYLKGGANFLFRLNNDVEFLRKLNRPNGFVYENGTMTKTTGINELNSLSGFRMGLNTGLGFSGLILPEQRIYFFSEVDYHYDLFNVIDDGDWLINNLSFVFGLKYNIDLQK